jgi:hypothetical protein
MSEDDRRAFGRTLRLSVSPGALRDYMRMNLDVDVCSVLPSIRVPTLILHRTEVARLDVRGARYLAKRIPGARLVELPAGTSPRPSATRRLFLPSFASSLTRSSRATGGRASPIGCSRPSSSRTSSTPPRSRPSSATAPGANYSPDTTSLCDSSSCGTAVRKWIRRETGSSRASTVRPGRSGAAVQFARR